MGVGREVDVGFAKGDGARVDVFVGARLGATVFVESRVAGDSVAGAAVGDGDRIAVGASSVVDAIGRKVAVAARSVPL